MPTIKFKLRLDAKATVSYVDQASRKAARRAARITAQRARRNVIKAGRVDTGRMLKSIDVYTENRKRLHPAYVVGPRTSYAKYQEYGTRAHGPKRAKAMRFIPKGGGAPVYAKWVRGVKAAHFMRNALESVSTRDFVQ